VGVSGSRPPSLLRVPSVVLMGIKAILFDMDGTIIENSYAFVQAKSEILETLSRRGLTVPEDLYGSIASLLVELGRVGDQAALSAREEIFKILAKYDEQCTESVKIRRGVTKLLRWLKSHSYKVGLVSNSNASVVERIIKEKRLYLLFDAVATREDVERMKPYPDMVFWVCAKLGVKPSDTLVVGDSWVDVVAGLNAGAKTVYFNARGAKISVKPTYEVSSMDELLELLRKGGLKSRAELV